MILSGGHVKLCRGYAASEGTAIPPEHAVFWAGSILIDVVEDPTEHDVAQLAQMAFPDVDALVIARASLAIAEAINKIRMSRLLAAQAKAVDATPEPENGPIIRHSNRAPACPECFEPVVLASLGPRVLPEVGFKCPHCGAGLWLHHEDDNVLLRRAVFG